MTPDAHDMLNGLVGQVVSQIRLDFALSLLFDENWLVVAEGPGSIDGIAFASGAYTEAAARLAALHRRVVSAAQLDADHALLLTFDSGAKLVAGIDPVYDSWHAVGPSRQRVHVEGAGRLTIFDGDARP